MFILKHILLGFSISVFIVSGFLMVYLSPSRNFAVYNDNNLVGAAPDDSAILNARDAAYNLGSSIIDGLIIDDKFISNTQDSKSGLPVRLTIPKINVDATVDLMGITSNGAMEAPRGPRDVGWFRLGSHPGDVGSAVIAGHYGTWNTGEGSVFDNLNKLGRGDNVYVQDDEGNFISFVVQEVRVFNAKDDASSIFTSSLGAHLNLITCDGAWDPIKKDYSQRLVVFTDVVQVGNL